jgi:hypothetical protein
VPTWHLYDESKLHRNDSREPSGSEDSHTDCRCRPQFFRPQPFKNSTETARPHWWAEHLRPGSLVAGATRPHLCRARTLRIRYTKKTPTMTNTFRHRESNPGLPPTDFFQYPQGPRRCNRTLCLISLPRTGPACACIFAGRILERLCRGTNLSQHGKPRCSMSTMSDSSSSVLLPVGYRRARFPAAKSRKKAALFAQLFAHRESNPELPPTVRIPVKDRGGVPYTMSDFSTYDWTCSCMHFFPANFQMSCSCGMHFCKTNSPEFLCALIVSLELPR